MSPQTPAWNGTDISTSPLNVPARLHPEEAAKILGFHPCDIPILVSAKLLKPLGNPANNGSKYFAAVTIFTLSRDCEWLDKATKIISRYWKSKNEKKRSRNGLQIFDSNDQQTDELSKQNRAS